MELPPLNLKDGNDFIPIENLPSEKFEIPSELLGKFEATKVEAPVVPAKEPKSSKFQQRQQRANNRNNNNNRPNNSNNNTSNTNIPAEPVQTEPQASLPAPVQQPAKPVENLMSLTIS